MSRHSYKAPAPPYLGPPKYHGDIDNKPIDWLVLHSTVSPCVPGGARSIARYFRETITVPASAHYVTDPREAVQVTWDSVEAYHCGYNRHSLGIEMCDNPGPMPSYAPGSRLWRKLRTRWRWADRNHRAMRAVTAKLVAQLCAAYDVPARFVGVGQLRAGRRGITTHANMSEAFHRSTHWDPGAWPRYGFMRQVRRELRKIKREGNR